MSLFVIDEVHLNQVEQLQSISRETFYETYCSMNTKENMDKYLNENLSISTLEKELKNPNSLFFIIRDLDKNIGYLKLNMGPAQTDIKDANALEIERIYVIKEYQGKKAGKQLYEKTIQVAKEKIVDSDDDISADRLKNAAATKKLAIFDAFEILNRIQEEENILEGKEPEDKKEKVFKGMLGSKYLIAQTTALESIPPDKAAPIGTSLLKCNFIFSIFSISL